MKGRLAASNSTAIDNGARVLLVMGASPCTGLVRQVSPARRPVR